MHPLQLLSLHRGEEPARPISYRPILSFRSSSSFLLILRNTPFFFSTSTLALSKNSFDELLPPGNVYVCVRLVANFFSFFQLIRTPTLKFLYTCTHARGILEEFLSFLSLKRSMAYCYHVQYRNIIFNI